MPLASAKPVNTPYTVVNMYRPPYRKRLPASYQMKGTKGEFQKDVDILFDTFLESYNDCKAGKMTKKMDEYCKLTGIPDSSQYKAFAEFIKLLDKEELYFLDEESFYYYNMTLVNSNSQLGLLEFIDNLTKLDFKEQKKKIVFTSGSFWEKKPEIREKLIAYFKILHDKSFEIELYMNAKESEDHMRNLTPLVNKNSRFGLKDRIPIHFLLCGDDYLFFEFPHTENIIVRLNMFMDLNTVALKPNKSKTDVVLFFDNLIKRVLENNA